MCGISTHDYGDWLQAVLMHPAAIFLNDITEKKADRTHSIVQAGMVVSLGADAARLKEAYLKDL